MANLSRRLVKGHTGKYLAKELQQCLKTYGIDKKILGVVADNASNNQVVVVELESLGGINSAATRVRCFAHVLNLVVKVSLSTCNFYPRSSFCACLSDSCIGHHPALCTEAEESHRHGLRSYY